LHVLARRASVPVLVAALIALIAGTFVLGVYPQPIFDALR